MKNFTPKFLSLLLVMFFQYSFAVNYVWTGAIDNSWATPGNWSPVSPAGGPSNFDNVTINSGTPNNPVLAASVVITNITMNAGSSLNVGTYTLTTVGSASYSYCVITGSSGYVKCNGLSNTITVSTFSVGFGINGNWFMTGSTFNNPVTLTKSGGSITQTSCGNTFNGPLNIVNNSGGVFRFGFSNGDTYNSTVYAEIQFNNATISFAYNSTNNIFNGNITIASTGVLGYLNFGIAGGTSTLNPGVTILEGGAGFLGGVCEIRNLTQLGTAITHSLDLSLPTCCSSTALILKLGPGVVFNGPVNFVASNILLNGGIYNGTTSYFTKSLNGSALSNASDGGNVFNSPDTYITNLTSSALTLANISPDDYNGNVHFQKGIGASNIRVAHNGINTFAGNIEVIGSTFAGTPPVQFGYGNGIVKLDGTGNQNIIRTNPGTVGPPSITRLEVNKSSGAVFLNTSIDILDSLSLVTGLINSSAGNYVIMNNGSETSIGNSLSYISGPMIYRLGNVNPATLNLPLGKAGNHRPAILQASHSNTTITSYTAEVIHSSAMALGYSMPPTINLVSYMRYWDISREAVANLNNASVTLFYGTDDGVNDPANLRVAKTIGSGTAWFDMGGSGSAATTGSITSSFFTSFSKFSLANNITGFNPLPIQVVDFNVKPEQKRVRIDWETANEKTGIKFSVERSSDAYEFEEIAIVSGSGLGTENQSYTAYDPAPVLGVGYYRLKQTDKDGEIYYSGLKTVRFNSSGTISVYPNPCLNHISISYNHQTSSIIRIRIYDATGKLVHEEFKDGNSGELMVTTSNLAEGIYILELNDTNENTYLKFSKTN